MAAGSIREHLVEIQCNAHSSHYFFLELDTIPGNRFIYPTLWL